jgi:hypothetical protein
MPDLNLANPLVLNYLTQNAIWWIEYADLDGWRAIITLTHKNCKMDKIHYDEYLIFILWVKYGCKIHRKWPIGKRQPISQIKITILLGNGLYTSRCIGKVFNEDDGSWDKGMIKLYDNFTNDYLYANQQYFSLC